jgi:FkbM family methyltransferase
MSDKPKNHYPGILRKILKKMLPPAIYQRHIGRHEMFSLFLWESLVRSLGPSEVVLDVGAFHGEYALLARKTNPNVKIFAFEPNPLNRVILEENVNGQDIAIESCAVGEKNDEVTFSLDSATSRILVSESNLQQGQSVKVFVVPLDSWTDTNHISPVLIKIDTEGFEAAILRGAQSILANDQPIILCEILCDDAGRCVMNALPAGYAFYHIDENKGITVRQVIDRKKWRNHNWLLVPESKHDWLNRMQA